MMGASRHCKGFSWAWVLRDAHHANAMNMGSDHSIRTMMTVTASTP